MANTKPESSPDLGEDHNADPDEDDESTTWSYVERSELVPGYFAWDLLSLGRRFELWIAWCRNRLTPVCVKIPRADQLTDRTVDALTRELAAAVSFNHPAIPRVFESSLDAEIPYIVYEYIEGKSLSMTVEDDGKMNSDDLVILGLQTAAALRHIHHRGYVHLDLKPANIVLRSDRVTLIDFDIALPVGGQRSLTKPRGTHLYMSPEQIRCEPAQPSMDVFALGATLYEAATGWPAFATRTSDSEDSEIEGWPRRYRQLDGAITPAAEVNPDISDAVSDVIQLFLEPDVAHRPQTAAEAIMELIGACDPGGEPLWPEWVNELVQPQARCRLD